MARKLSDRERKRLQPHISEFAAALKAVPSRNISPPRFSDNDLLACYVMGDPHMGMYSWAEETGSNYDLKIARRLTTGAVDNLVSRAPRAGTAILVSLGDLIHSDTKQNRTEASGHPLDVDTRWPRVMDVTLETMIHCIRRLLQKHARVIVRLCEGNHDPQASRSIAASIREHFRLERRVQLDLSPANYWFHGWGANCIGATHGHKCKTAKLPSIMAATVPKLWGASIANGRAFYQGHLHHTKTEEMNGCTVHVMPTLCAPDAYAAGAGYISSRSMSCDVYHRRAGFIRRETCPVELLGRTH